MKERRSTVRKRSFLGGRIAFNERSAPMNCLVRNITPEGAKIAFSEAVALPQDLDLAIEHKGLRGRVRVVWRAGDELGISFLDEGSEPANAKVVPLDWARRLKQAEADKAALRRRIDELCSTAD